MNNEEEKSKNKSKPLNDYFIKIDDDEFQIRSQRPLWLLGDGLLYLMGYRFNFDAITRNTVGRMNFVRKFLNTTETGAACIDFAHNDYKDNKLELLTEQYTFSPDFLDKKVSSQELIKWAQKLPFDLPILIKETTNRDYMTADMKLMMDAVDKFWSHYDLQNPDKNTAPFKNEVVNWLRDEGKKRNIDDFSKSRADLMDTIMRCPVSRKGGNTR